MTTRSNNEFSESFLHDQELLAQHRSGDGAAFAALFEKYQGLAYSNARKFVTTQDKAEDIVLESFTRILETIRRGKGPTVSMQHYLVTTIRTVAISHGILGELELSKTPEEVAELYEQENFQDGVVTASWLSDAFNLLDERAQSVMWLRVVEGLPSREVAKTLGVNPVTVTRVYQSAVRRFREHFVAVALAEAKDPDCQQNQPYLLKIARGKDAPPNAHVDGCRLCSAIQSRLHRTEQSKSQGALLSIVFLVGLGALALDGLKMVPANAAKALTVANKVVLSSLVLLSGTATVLTLTQILPLPNTAPQKQSEIAGTALPELPVGTSAPLLSIGDCEVVRDTRDGSYEVWRVSNNYESCNVSIEYLQSAGSGEGTIKLDTFAEPAIRTVEIGRSGIYQVRVKNGSEELSKTFVASGF